MTAFVTGLAFSGMNPMGIGERSGYSVGTDVLTVAERGPASSYRLAQNLLHRRMEPLDIDGTQGFGSPGRPHARSKTDLIGVDRADSSDDFLIKENRLQRAPAIVQPSGEILARCYVIPRIRTEMIKRIIPSVHDKHFAERARVHKSQFSAASKLDTNMRVFDERFLNGCHPQKLATHSKVHDKAVAVFEIYKQVFADTRSARYDGADKFIDEVVRLDIATHGAQSTKKDTGDFATHDQIVDVTPNRFDFR